MRCQSSVSRGFPQGYCDSTTWYEIWSKPFKNHPANLTYIFWHIFCHSIWQYLAFYLTYVLTFYLILSGILSDIYSDILSGIYSGILFDFIWHSIWHIFWHSIWHFFGHSIWHIFWHSIWHFFGILSDIYSDILFDILSGIYSRGLCFFPSIYFYRSPPGRQKGKDGPGKQYHIGHQLEFPTNAMVSSGKNVLPIWTSKVQCQFGT